MEILPSSADLAGAFRDALDSVARERRYLLFTEAPPLESVSAFVQGLVERGESQLFAVEEGRVLGWCDVIRKDRPGLRHSGQLGMAVVAGHRGRGIGRRLLEAAVMDAFSKGIERVELEVFASNEPAIRLYLRSGFVEEGRKKNARLLDGAYDDILVMARLRPA
ncbi:MAG: GNAT family N-acetyltransferase [Elusimicrobia bacterium]|nr:GNAT family N-acetyltransferase [Elusimicrobiota bacterium]